METFSEILKKEFYIKRKQYLKTLKSPYYWIFMLVIFIVSFILGSNSQ